MPVKGGIFGVGIGGGWVGGVMGGWGGGIGVSPWSGGCEGICSGGILAIPFNFLIITERAGQKSPA